MITSRRTSDRHAVLENRARLTWWVGGEGHESAARLVNLSEGGALFIAESPPPLHHAVWCRLEEPTRTDWIKAIVVRHGEAQEIGLSFPTACPFDFTIAATLGLNFDSLFRDPEEDVRGRASSLLGFHPTQVLPVGGHRSRPGPLGRIPSPERRSRLTLHGRLLHGKFGIRRVKATKKQRS